MASSTSGYNMDLLAGDWSLTYANSYYNADYTGSGYNSYLTKSIDLGTQTVADQSTATLSSAGQYSDNAINYDSSTVTGALGDILQIGNITIDGSIGRIAVYDVTGTEVLRLGALDD